MPPRRKGRKKQKKDPERQKKLQSFMDDFNLKVQLHLEQMEKDCESICKKVDQYYELALQDIDPRFHDMTLSEISKLKEQQQKTPEAAPKEISCLSTIESRLKSIRHEALTASVKRSKSEKKSFMDTMRKKALESSSYVRYSTNTKGKRRVLGSIQQHTTPVLKRKLPITNTPVFKNNHVKHSRMIVTPKFDPRTPLPNMLLRRPKPGEVIMSLSGSPLQNSATPPSEKPGVLLSFGSGRVVNIADLKQMSHTEASKIDSETKANLLVVQQQLAHLLEN